MKCYGIIKSPKSEFASLAGSGGIPNLAYPKRKLFSEKKKDFCFHRQGAKILKKTFA